MTLSDFLTFATIALAIVIVTPFLGRYIYRVMEGERVFLSPVVRPVERLDLSRVRHRRDRRAGLEGLCRLRARDGLRRDRRRLRRLPPAGRPAPQPGRHPADVAGSRLQHVGQLRDQHQLAELLGRDRRHVPDAGGGPRGSQLHLGRDRPGHRHRPVPRPHPAQLEDDRQLLGRPHPRRALHPAADLDRRARSSSSGRACRRRGSRRRP